MSPTMRWLPLAVWSLLSAIRSANASAAIIAVSNDTEFAAALRTARAGDSVQLRAGTYTVNLSPLNAGTLGNPITIEALPADACQGWLKKVCRVVIDGRNTNTTVNIDKNYIRIRGLEIVNSSGNGITVSGANGRTGTEVLNNKIHGNRSDGMSIAGDILIDNNEIFGHNLSPLANHADGIQYGGDFSNSIVISNNVLYDNGQELVLDQFAIPAGTMMRGIRIFRNLVFKEAEPSSVGTKGIGITAKYAPVADVEIYGNTVLNCKFMVITDGPFGLTGVNIHDNIFYSDNPASEKDIAVLTGNVTNGVADRNVYYSNTSYAIVSWNGTAYAGVQQFKTATGQEAHGVQADPRFVDAANFDFRPQAGSPACTASATGGYVGALPCAPAPAPVQTCATISQYGITWTFDKAYLCGQFVGGDWWAVGPLTVTAVTPGWDGAKHGSMLDPVPTAPQGFDSRTYGYPFSDANRAKFPLALSGAKSLISSIGLATKKIGGAYDTLQDAAVLTVLNAAPPANSFRPPYVAGAKKIWTTSDANYGLIPTLPAPAGITLPNVANVMVRPNLYFGPEVWGTEILPTGNVTDVYPAYENMESSKLSLMVMLASPQKQEYANRLIQRGIDHHAISLQNGKAWQANGGFGVGLKWPILFAGILFNDSGMKSPPMYASGIGTGSNIFKFAEDAYTFYANPTAQYPQGYPAFGIDWLGQGNIMSACTSNCMSRDYSNQPPYDPEVNPAYGANSGGYRLLVSQFWVGQTLAAYLMNAKSVWNHDAYFTYMDRWISEPQTWQDISDAYKRNIYGYGDGSGFVQAMWNQHRNATSPPPAQAPVNAAPTVSAGPDRAATSPASASLDGTVTDDGLPSPPAAVTSAWSKVSGPGTVTFGNAAAVDTTASFSAAGSYVLRLTASDGTLSASDDVAVTVSPAPTPAPANGPLLVKILRAPGQSSGEAFLRGGDLPILVEVSKGACSAISTVGLKHTDVDAPGALGFSGNFRLERTNQDGSEVYLGSLPSRLLAAKAGTVQYQVTALDSCGRSALASGSFRVETADALLSAGGDGAFRAWDGNAEITVRPAPGAGLTQVQVRRLDADDPSLWRSGQKPAAVYEFTVPGQSASVFNQPLSITLGVDSPTLRLDASGALVGAGAPLDSLKAYYKNVASGRWVLLGGRLASGAVTFQTNHFTTFALFPSAGVEALEAKAQERFLSPALVDGFNDVATFGPNAQEVSIFDVAGRRVFHATQNAGSAISWNCRDGSGRMVESGVYLARIQSGGSVVHQSFTVVK